MPTELTQFKEGASGNPTGRPKGSKNKITLLRQSLELQLREAARDRMPEVLDKAFELAIAGNTTMIKLLLELHMAKGGPDQVAGTENVSILISTQATEPVKTTTAIGHIIEGDYEEVESNG